MKYALIFFFLIALNSWAGGSAHKDDILEMVYQANFSSFAKLTEQFALEETGECVRLPSGERILPCSIRGTRMLDEKLFLLELSATGDITETLLSDAEKVRCCECKMSDSGQITSLVRYFSSTGICGSGPETEIGLWVVKEFNSTSVCEKRKAINIERNTCLDGGTGFWH